MSVSTSKNSQKGTARALEKLLGSKARFVVLRVFLLDPLRAYYQRQLEAAVGLPIRAVQRELIRLTDAGFLYRRVEGNRAYYQVDLEFSFFPELRAMMLKVVSPRDRLRGALAMTPGVRQAFLAENGGRALVVSGPDGPGAMDFGTEIPVEVMETPMFVEAVRERNERLEPYLVLGEDLLGWRSDVIWRSIEEAGYIVKKGEGVP